MSSFLSVIKKVIGITKKIFLVVAVYFLIISLFMYFINKDKPKISYDPIQKNRQEIYKLINDKKLNSTKEGKLTITIYRAMTCGFIGEACTDNPDDGNKNYQKSILGFMGNLIALPYANPPASGVYWAYSGLQNAGFIPKTYAAEGIGFAAIKPFMNLWKVFRDIAYMLLVLVLIAIGFMIMFRMKLNPQTVISVENSLPRIVISLLLITFSFPIAGFLIDLMYVLIIIGIALIAKADPNLSALPRIDIQNQYLNSNIKIIWDSMFFDNSIWSRIPLIGGFSTLFAAGDAIVNILPAWINDLVRGTTALLFANAIMTFILKKIGMENLANILDNINIIGNSLGKVTSSILKPLLGIVLFGLVLPLTLIHGGGWLIGILIGFTMVYTLFRIFFMLFFAYLKILLMVIFAPLFMLFQAFPGKNPFSFWFKTLFGEILAFPTTVILLIIGRVITNSINSPGANIWHPPFLYNIDAKSFSILLGLGLIFMIPDMVKLLKELLGVKGLPVGFNLGTFFSGVGAGYGGAMAGLQQFSGLANFPGISNLMGKIPGIKTLKGHLIPPTQESLIKAQTKALLEGRGLQPDEVDKRMEKFSEELLGPTTPPKTGGGH